MAFPDSPIQGQGDGGGRSVGVAIDGEDGLLRGQLETLSDRVNDAQVGLVGDEPSMAVAFVFVTSRISSTAWPRRWTAFLYTSRTFVLKPTSADIGPEGNRRAPLTARDKAKVQE